MQYMDTRGGGDTKSFKQILIEGLAPSGGLYTPMRYPELDIKGLRGKTYQEIALEVFNAYMPDIPRADMAAMIARVYTKAIFGTHEITPVKMLTPGLGLLKLAEGPTLAFKDVALQMLTQLMDYVLDEIDDYLNIEGSTSGDTGSAAEVAAIGKSRLRVFMLSPLGRMSRFQQDQMYTINDPRIHNLVIEGTFDDCQDLVKESNRDLEFKKRYKIGAVNSINWARIVAQIVYYVYGYYRMTSHDGETLRVVVPSGNFGNALAAYIAREMGVPITIVIATNENDVLDEFFRTGIYRVRKDDEVKATMSPSMDIAAASNLERLLFDIAGRDSGQVRNFYGGVARTGSFNAGGWFPSQRSGITSGKATEEQVAIAIREVYERYHVLIDPHTAVAYVVANWSDGNVLPTLIAETAQPAKFEDSIKSILGFKPQVPRGFEDMSSRPRYITQLPKDVELVKGYIAKHAA